MGERCFRLAPLVISPASTAQRNGTIMTEVMFIRGEPCVRCSGEQPQPVETGRTLCEDHFRDVAVVHFARRNRVFEVKRCDMVMPSRRPVHREPLRAAVAQMSSRASTPVDGCHVRAHRSTSKTRETTRTQWKRGNGNSAMNGGLQGVSAPIAEEVDRALAPSGGHQ